MRTTLGGQRDGAVSWVRARPLQAGLAGLLALSAGTVAGTGVWLARSYRPGPWDPAARIGPSLGGGWIHEVHAWSAIVLAAALGLLVGSAILAAVRRASPDSVLLAVGGLTTATALVFAFEAARDLRFELLGLWAVRVDNPLEGIWAPAFSDTVRFFFVPGRGEVLPAEYRTELVAHAVAAPLAVLVATAATLAMARARPIRRG